MGPFSMLALAIAGAVGATALDAHTEKSWTIPSSIPFLGGVTVEPGAIAAVVGLAAAAFGIGGASVASAIGAAAVGATAAAGIKIVAQKKPEWVGYQAPAKQVTSGYFRAGALPKKPLSELSDEDAIKVLRERAARRLQAA